LKFVKDNTKGDKYVDVILVQLNYWEALNPRPPTPKMERVPLNTKEKLLLTNQNKTQKMLRTFSNKG